DRLIDLLAIGYTYPLRDLPIPELTTVAYNVTAQIVVEYSQIGVSYRLCDKEHKSLSPEVKALGNGGPLTLTTPPIKEDRTFTIEATKLHGKTPAVFLRQLAAVKVGLDTTLTAQIVGAALLSPSDTPAPADARIVDYGAGVQVEIELTQEGVDYQLVRVDGKKETVLSASARGNLGAILLQADGVTEDFDIRVRATKTFDPSEHKPTQTSLLDAVLPLKVRANPAAAVTVAAPILVYGGSASVAIDKSQASANYQLLQRAIADAEFIHGGTDPKAIKVAVAGQADVLVRSPATSDGFA
ncbi:hypothetical protein, partial [Methylogaea oryzae]